MAQVINKSCQAFVAPYSLIELSAAVKLSSLLLLETFLENMNAVQGNARFNVQSNENEELEQLLNRPTKTYVHCMLSTVLGGHKFYVILIYVFEIGLKMWP